jgi:single-strand DNA-binding protein
MNSVTLIGRLTNDIVLRERGATKIASFRLAVPRRRRGGEDQGAVFVDVTVFDKLAESCSTYLSKGKRVAVGGRLEYGEWKVDGETRSKHEVIAQEVQFLDPAPAEPAPTSDEEQSDDAPQGASQDDGKPETDAAPKGRPRRRGSQQPERDVAGASA